MEGQPAHPEEEAEELTLRTMLKPTGHGHETGRGHEKPHGGGSRPPDASPGTNPSPCRNPDTAPSPGGKALGLWSSDDDSHTGHERHVTASCGPEARNGAAGGGAGPSTSAGVEHNAEVGPDLLGSVDLEEQRRIMRDIYVCFALRSLFHLVTKSPLSHGWSALSDKHKRDGVSRGEGLFKTAFHGR